LYVSENYVRYKTICVMVHKDALSKELKKKLEIE
jgi:bleomycin hydrolase